MLTCTYATYCTNKIRECVEACRSSLKTVCCFDVCAKAAWSCSVTVVPKTSGIYAVIVDLPFAAMTLTGTMSHWGYIDTCISRVTCSGTTCTEQQTRNTYDYCQHYIENDCIRSYNPAVLNIVYACPTDKCVTVRVSHGYGSNSDCAVGTCGKAYIVEL